MLQQCNQDFLPKNGSVFSLSCPRVRRQTKLLFDLFFFAKDFDTFFKAACWARRHVQSAMFFNAYTTALIQRDDCQSFVIPPAYEIMPSFFVPQETMHEAYDYKMKSIKQGHFVFNNTGYDYNYHEKNFDFEDDMSFPHLEHKISYFREDVGGNLVNGEFHFMFPSFINDTKYNKTVLRKGDYFLFSYEQFLARYNLERIANDLPKVDPLIWTKPISVGYNPRVTTLNGRAFVTRPDLYNPSKASSVRLIEMSKEIEHRLNQAIDYGSIWLGNPDESKLTSLINENGIEIFGQIISGMKRLPYYGNYFWVTLSALSQMVKTKDDTTFTGGVIDKPFGSLRDPAFYSFLQRFVHLLLVQKLKSKLPFYQQKDLLFPGVKIESLNIDKLDTYFEMFDFEITNGVAARDIQDYNDTRYTASQFRLNSKPFTFNIIVESDDSYEAMVRIFVGPERDSERRRPLTLEQKRHAMVELDRFSTKRQSILS